MLQQIISRASFSAQTNVRGSNPFLTMHSVANSATQAVTVPGGGTFRNLRVFAEAAFASGSNVVGLFVNGSSSALSGTIDSGNQTFTDTDSVTVSDTDTVELRFNMTSAPTHVLRIALEFESAVANRSIYGFGGATSAAHGTYDGLMFGGGVQGWVVSAVPAEADDLVSTDGAYTEMRIRAGSAPGGGNSRTWVIYRNGVAQDGTGGTPDTRVTLTGSATGSAVFSLGAFDGDVVRVGHSTTGSPTTFNVPVTGVVAFDSLYANRWMMGATGNNGPSGTSTLFAHPFVNRIAIAFATTESNFLQRSGPTAFYLSGLRVLMNGSPGASRSWAYTLRQNAADTVQTVTIADSAVGGTSVGAAVQITDGNDLSIEVTPANTPNAAGYTKWVFVGSEAPPDETPTGGGCTSPCGPGGGGPPGPGGGSPGGPPNDTPRVIPPGGADPTYTPCDTGGDPATAVDPTNPQSMTDVTTPLAHLQLTLRNGTILRYGDHAFTSGNGNAVEARVRSWGPIVDSISDRECQIQSQRTTVRLSDADRQIRSLLSSPVTSNIQGVDAIHYIESAAAATTPNVLSRGVVVNWRGLTDMEIELDIADPMGIRYSPVSLDRIFPLRRIRTEIFPTAPENVIGRVIPTWYGELSDDFTWSFTPSRIPAGIIPVIHVGMAGDIPGLEGFEDMWQAWVVCGHAIAGIQSWFASNNDATTPGSVRMELGTEGVDFLIPGYAGFAARHPTPYIDLTDTAGITERFTMIFSRGPRGDAAVDGSIPITLNGCGIEEFGNGSGSVITNTISQIQHFICEWHLRNYRTGLWQGVPLYPDGTPKISIPSFNRARDIVNARNGGYFGAWYIGTEDSMRSWLAKLCLGADLRPGTEAGRMIVATLDEAATPTATYDETHIAEAQFDVDPRSDDVFNIQGYYAAYEPATGRFAWPMTTRRHEASITDNGGTPDGERPADPIEIMTTQLLANAQDVVIRRLDLASRPRPLATFQLDLRGLAPAIGDVLDVTHPAGIGPDGWSNRQLRLLSRTTDLNEFLCTMAAEDVEDLV